MAEKSEKTDQKSSQEGTKKDEPSKAADVVSFAGHIEIDPNRALPQHNVGRNKAYKAVSRGRVSGSLFALICERHYVPRRNAASVYASIVNPALLPLVSYGKVYWPPAKQERYVMVYKDVLGERLLSDDQESALGWKEDTVMDKIVKPMANILQDFRDKDFVHGSIRPSNMFLGKGSSQSRYLILGDCLSMQASYTQPVLYEPIERAQADPVARGSGTLTDDLYSFGVSLAVIMRSRDPFSSKDDEHIIREKLSLGSYAAITGNDRFKGSILELLRGLLHDDPLQRWTTDEVLIWLDGRRLSPKQALKRKKAARPLSFIGKKFTQPELLAMSVDILPNETVKIVEDGSLEQWLTRSLDDKKAAERLVEAYQSSTKLGRGAGYEDRIVANVSSVLDTMGPLRFCSLRVAGDGIGNGLYEAVVLKQDIKVFANMFLQSIAMNWVTATENPNLDITGLIAKFDSCRGYMRQNKFGLGLERCLYLLAPEAPCLSAKVQDYYISSPEELMYAFESLCEKGETPHLFLDRHSIAFLSVHDPKSIDPFLYDLNSVDDRKKLLANLKCLATLQKRSKLDKFPYIAKAFSKRFHILYDRFHDKKIREKLEESIEKFVKLGNLSKIVNVLDSPEVHESDSKGFHAAQIEYAELRDEQEKLDEQLKTADKFGIVAGKDFAALVSCGLSVLAMVVILYFFMADKNFF